MKPLCIYHNADLDGLCSAAIIRHRYGDVDFLGYNYGYEIPWHRIENRDVIMVDCSFSFLDWEMQHLLNVANSLTWIDHHQTALDAAQGGWPRLTIPGLRRVGTAACALCWEYCYGPNVPLPRTVKHIAAYDVWDHSDPDTVAFQYGARLLLSTPDQQTWEPLLNEKDDQQLSVADVLVQTMIVQGRTICAYLEDQNKIAIKARSFETWLDGHRCIAANAPGSNSQLFDSINKEDYDMMIVFGWTAGGFWRCSLYTVHDGIDCGKIAGEHGGGGHAKAAGFQCEELPFALAARPSFGGRD